MVARRSSTVLTEFEEESRLLERIYYKGKNQHRSALFWRNVQEIRRLCSCFRRLQVHTSVTQIRHAFYNSVDYHNQAILKSSWTHLPDVSALESATQTFLPSRKLSLKMSDRFLCAYSSFKRAMQTGAFLQLILTLSAITCRLHALAQVFLGVHEELTLTLEKLFNSLETSCTNTLPGGSPATAIKMTHEKQHEDSLKPLVVSPEAENNPPFLKSRKPMKDVGPDRHSSFIERKRQQTNPDSKRPATEVTSPKPPSNPVAARVPITRPKKKKPIDEIDLIFGF